MRHSGAKLIKLKLRQTETVDEYSQDFEALVKKSYGRRAGMDHASMEMLKRDLFVQGLLMRWPEKVVPSASTFVGCTPPGKNGRGA